MLMKVLVLWGIWTQILWYINNSQMIYWWFYILINDNFNYFFFYQNRKHLYAVISNRIIQVRYKIKNNGFKKINFRTFRIKPVFIYALIKCCKNFHFERFSYVSSCAFFFKNKTFYQFSLRKNAPRYILDTCNSIF